MLFERDRQVILIFDAVVVAEIRAAVGAAAAERIGHVNGQSHVLRLLISAFALVLKTGLVNHLRVDDPGLGQPQVVTRVITVRRPFGQSIVAGTAPGGAAEAAEAAPSSSYKPAAAEAEPKPAAEAGSELEVRNFGGAVVVVQIEGIV